MEVKFTYEQQAVIDARDCNLLVSAAAGSGKTAVMVERVKQLVLNGTPVDRMLVVTFFMKYYPDLLRRGHVHILQTPLFRVHNKKQTAYCYSIEEKEAAVKKLKTGVEITRFKGLGEISSHEFVDFIGENMRLDPVKLADEESIAEIMEFYMGDNTGERQRFIMTNLRSEEQLEDVNI